MALIPAVVVGDVNLYIADVGTAKPVVHNDRIGDIPAGYTFFGRTVSCNVTMGGESAPLQTLGKLKPFLYRRTSRGGVITAQLHEVNVALVESFLGELSNIDPPYDAPERAIVVRHPSALRQDLIGQIYYPSMALASPLALEMQQISSPMSVTFREILDASIPVLTPDWFMASSFTYLPWYVGWNDTVTFLAADFTAGTTGSAEQLAIPARPAVADIRLGFWIPEITTGVTQPIRSVHIGADQRDIFGDFEDAADLTVATVAGQFYATTNEFDVANVGSNLRVIL